MLPDAPDFRALLHTRVRHFAPVFYAGSSAWLSWVSPLQGVPSHRAGDGLHRASPHEVARLGDESSARALYRVLLPDEIGLSLSRLPTLLGFATS
jgi:hypothetical protein